MDPAHRHTSPLTVHAHSIRREPDRFAALTLIPAFATGLYYILPSHLQRLPSTQFMPQILAYVSFGMWITLNHGIMERLGLQSGKFRQGATWGLVVGLVLGVVNTWVILWVVPSLGSDIQFLKDTPHAQISLPLMMPWLIILIAVFVELNFRGFQLGRWMALLSHPRLPAAGKIVPGIAVGLTSVTFAFDPFMVSTFKHLHWIALWDGVVWGTLWLRLRNLYVTIVAHAVEVIIAYSIIRAILK